MRELYINNEPIELDDDAVIALTFQVNNIAELKDRQGNYSNQFKLKQTNNNRRILGFANDINSDTIKPYRKLPAKVIQNGAEIIPNGFAIIEESNRFFEVTVYSGILDFFTGLADKSILDLDLSEYNHPLNSANMYSSRLYTEGFLYPIINYADFNLTQMIANRQLPAVFVHSLVEKIFEDSGYTSKGKFLSDQFYKRLIIPGTRTARYSDEFIKARTAVAGITNRFEDEGNADNYEDLVRFDLIGKTPSIDVDTFVQGSQNNFHTDTYSYIADTPLFVNVKATVIFFINVVIGSATISLTLTKNEIPVVSSSRTEGGNVEFAELTINTSDLYLNTGDELKVRIKFEGSGIYEYTKTIYHSDDSGQDSNGMPEALFSITPTDRIPTNATLKISELLPDLRQKDLLKCLAQQFALIFQANNVTNKIDIRQFKEIYENIPSAKDWSKKLDLSKEPSIKYRFDSYAKNNNLMYLEDEVDIDEQSLNTDKPNVITVDGEGVIVGANGVISINDETLSENEKDLFTLPFAASVDQETKEGVKYVTIKKASDNTGLTDSKSIKPRILALKYEERTVTYRDGINADITSPGPKPIGYFINSDQEYNLGFDNNLIDKNYAELKRVLEKTKIVTAYFTLTENDISELDFFIPVYVDYFGHYFYINQVKNYTENKSTLVELVRL